MLYFKKKKLIFFEKWSPSQFYMFIYTHEEQCSEQLRFGIREPVIKQSPYRSFFFSSLFFFCVWMYTLLLTPSLTLLDQILTLRLTHNTFFFYLYFFFLYDRLVDGLTTCEKNSQLWNIHTNFVLIVQKWLWI